MPEIGVITAITNQVAEVTFAKNPPKMNDILAAVDHPEVKLVVHSSAEKNSFFCLILSENDHLARGSHVQNTNEGLTVPVGQKVLGRAFDIFGKPLDGAELVTQEKRLVFHTNFPSLEDVVAPNEILETGVKAIDFFSPLLIGGKMGLFGGAGVGKTILLTELINNIVIQTQSTDKRVSIFSAVGERSREAHELIQILREAKVIDKTSLVVGQMGENPAIRFQTAFAAARLAEYFRDEQETNVLFFMDNIYRFAQAGYELSTVMRTIPSEDAYQPTLPSEIGSLHERLTSTKKASITSVEAVYVPSDDMNDYAVRSLFPFLDSNIIFSRQVYQEGRYPAIDLLSSGSSAMRPDIVGEKHYDLYMNCKNILEKSITIDKIVSLVGLSELSHQDQTVYIRAQLIKNYMTQSFFVAHKQTDRIGQFVSLAQTIKDVEMILRGAFDKSDPEELLFVSQLPTPKTPTPVQQKTVVPPPPTPPSKT